MNNDIMNKQVGGDHYKKHKKMQPWEIIDAYQLNYYEGNALKYLLRKKGDRVEDLEKLIHYIEKEIVNLKNDKPVVPKKFILFQPYMTFVTLTGDERKERDKAIENWLKGSDLFFHERKDELIIIGTHGYEFEEYTFSTYEYFMNWLHVTHPELLTKNEPNG